MGWVTFVVAHPRAVLAILAISVAFSGAFTKSHFKINTDNTKVIRQDVPFRQNYVEFNKSFPHYDQSTLVVVSAETRRQARSSALELADELRNSPDVFSLIHVPSEGDFFDDHGLLYLDLEELELVVERLSEAQPALAALNNDPSLRGLSHELVNAIEAGAALPGAFTRICSRLAEIGEGVLAGRGETMSWDEEFLVDRPGDAHEVIFLQGAQRFEEATPSQRQMDEIQWAAERLGFGSGSESGVQVRRTGMVPLAHEELQSLVSSIGLAGAISITALVAIMVFGMRSLRIIIATLIAVFVAIAWTFAFGLVAVGEFNTISIAFSVLMIGLGVDFAIHFCLRYQESLESGASNSEATTQASAAVGVAVSLCALTSSIGFLSFVPTDYIGLADLGIISGGGLFFAVIASFTAVPAVLAIGRTPRGRAPRLAVSMPIIRFLTQNSKRVTQGAALVALIAGGYSMQMTFDFSTLGMKDPNSESMKTLTLLHEERILTDYAVTVLAPSWEAVPDLVQRLRELSSVAEVRMPDHYLPQDQDTKLMMLEDAQDFMWPVLRHVERASPPSQVARRESLRNLADALGTLTPERGSADMKSATDHLRRVLERLLLEERDRGVLETLEDLVLSDLDDQLDWLRRVLAPNAATFAELPRPLRQRLVSQDGKVLLSVLPTEDVRNVDNLKHFVDQVLSVAPSATGRPVVEAGIGVIVVNAFRKALTIAFAVVALVLLVALRDPLESLMVLAPIVLATLLTIATGMAVGLRFNMANVVVIPLVVGLGVDNGIHIVMRYREGGGIMTVLRSSTPRAILLSGLTTLGAFGGLSVSSHGGIHSLGVLLSLAMIYLMLCTLLVLPALLAWRHGERLADSVS